MKDVDNSQGGALKERFSGLASAVKNNGLKDGIRPSASSLVISAIFACLFIVVAASLVADMPWVNQFNMVAATSIQSLRADGLTPFVTTFTQFGDTSKTILAVLLTLLILFIGRRYDDFVFFTCSVGVVEILFQVFKLIFRNPRPIGQAIIELPDSFSFPSSHSANGIFFTGMLLLVFGYWLYQRFDSRVLVAVLCVAAVAFGIALGLSRIYVGVHWGTDVLGGILIGAAFLVPIASWYLRWKKEPPVYGKHAR